VATFGGIRMIQLDEIAHEVFRLCAHVPEIDLQFNHFFIRGDEPMLYHAGMRRMFPPLRQAVARG